MILFILLKEEMKKRKNEADEDITNFNKHFNKNYAYIIMK